MSYILSVSPDFSPDHLSGWFIFNTWLQRCLGEQFHLELYDDFESQRDDIKSDKIDLIYANPYDAAMLVRDKGFKALAKPSGLSDEAIIAVLDSSPYRRIEELSPGIRIACTQDPDVNMMSMIMIEPADLDRSTIELHHAGSYVLVAKALLNDQADVGFFLKDAFNDLSDLVRDQMRVLVEGQIDVVHHTLMVGPKLQSYAPRLLDELVAMSQDEKGRSVLEPMSFQGWDPMEVEDTEFMIDLIDTLLD